jgi:hypothetical protein
MNDTTTSPGSALTIEKLLKAKALFDIAKNAEVSVWWESVNPFQIWFGAYQNMPWTELPEHAKHELVGVYDSLPIPVCQH